MARGTTDRFSGQFTDARSFQRPEACLPSLDDRNRANEVHDDNDLLFFDVRQDTDNLKSNGCNHDNQYI